MLAILFLLPNSAEARRHYRQHYVAATDASFNFFNPMQNEISVPVERGQRLRYANYDRGTVLGSNGSVGCPRHAACGCVASVKVFGTPKRDLYLAANWLRFPRAAPAPGMVAARHGHVFVLEAQASNGQWTVYDGNSGGGMIRRHVRSLAGYTIVNPHA